MSTGDHSKAAKDLLEATVPVYASRGTLTAIGLYTHHRAKDISNGEGGGVKFGGRTWEAQSLDTVHDAEESLGFTLKFQEPGEWNKKLLYMADTAYSKYKFNGLTHILIETNYARDILEKNLEEGKEHYAKKHRLLKAHHSLEDTKEFLRECGLNSTEEIHLLHLSRNNADPTRFREEIQEEFGIPTYIAE